MRDQKISADSDTLEQEPDIVQDALEQVEEVVAQAAPWIDKLARLGYVSRGIVYATMGTLAAQAALGARGLSADSEGALRHILVRPLGVGLLIVLTIGLTGFAIWRIVQAIVDPDNNGRSWRGLSKRAAYMGAAVMELGLAFTAGRLSLGIVRSDGEELRDITKLLMAWAGGSWLVAGLGLIVLSVAASQLRRAYKASFREKLASDALSETEERWVVGLGRFGFATRGIVFALMGAFLVRAAYEADPEEVRGLGDTLDALALQPYGPWLLGIAAAGFLAYAMLMIVAARYRKINL